MPNRHLDQPMISPSLVEEECVDTNTSESIVMKAFSGENESVKANNPSIPSTTRWPISQ